jgi:hypothetical protein
MWSPDAQATSKVVRVSSHDATSGRGSDFSVDLLNAGSQLGQVYGVSVDAVSFPRAFPNIKQGRNKFKVALYTPGPVFSPVGDQDYILPTDRFINIDDLIVLLNSVNANIQFYFRALTGRVSIETSPVFTHTLSGIGLEAIGFLATPPLGTPLINTETPYWPNLSGDSIVYLHSDVIAGGVFAIDSGNGRTVNHVMGIPLTVPHLENQTYLPSPPPTRPTIVFAAPNDISRIDLRLRDVYGGLLDIGAGEMTVVLRFWTLSI